MEMSRDTIGKPRGIQPTERQGDPIVSNYINSCRRTSVRSLLASALVPLAAGAGSVEDVEQNYTSDASGSADSLEWWIDRVPTPSQLTPSVDTPEISRPHAQGSTPSSCCATATINSATSPAGTSPVPAPNSPSTTPTAPPKPADHQESPPAVVAPQAGTTGREPPDNNEPAPHTPTVEPRSQNYEPCPARGP
jgi:hypothetical protein